MAKIKINTEGLEGDELKAAQKLEKNLSVTEDLTTEQVKAVVSEQLKEAGLTKEQLQSVLKALDKDNPESVHESIKMVNDRMDDFVKESKKTEGKQKSFNDNLMEMIHENVDDIKKAVRQGGETRIGELKAVGDMSIAANFTNSLPYLNDVRNNLIETPFNRTFISDVILQGSTDKPWVTYPKENGGEGGAAMWVDRDTDKAQMDFDLTSKSNYVHWNAGYVIVDRDFLDDISFAESYIRAKMLLSLKNSRDNFVLNGVTDASDTSKSVDGLLDVATAYTMTTGLTDNPVNRIIDSGYGQLISDTKGFYVPTHTVLNPRTAVRIGLNQASGSGEYDLPQGSVGFVNGRLNVGGMDVLRSFDEVNFTQEDFLTFDRTAAMLIARMKPELVVFVDAALAKRNKVMLRIEERVTLAIFNNQAIVKGTIPAPTT